ncbi:MAG: LysR family transcriptional regulator [Lachnospiraceae bacterium]|nr:LysR family transcriptional regulator [Lachnospiraceae bacterium]
MNQLNLYHIFYTVAQCGNISAAAKKLYISQPAVSKSISKLEENFPTPLLQRTSKGVILTESGQILYQQLETAFQAIKQGEEQIHQNNALGVGSISIGVSTTLCKYVLLPYLKDFLAANPNVKVSISCQSTYETLTALDNGTLDIGLVGESERLGNLNFQPLQTIHDTLVTSPEYLEKLTEEAAQVYEKADITSLTEKELMSSATFLMLNKNNVTRQYVDRYLAKQDIALENRIEVTTMDLLIDFAKLGLGIACVIKEFVTEEFKQGELLEFVTEETIPERKIGFAYSKRGQNNTSVKKFLNNISLNQS